MQRKREERVSICATIDHSPSFIFFYSVQHGMREKGTLYQSRWWSGSEYPVWVLLFQTAPLVDVCGLSITIIRAKMQAIAKQKYFHFFLRFEE